MTGKYKLPPDLFSVHPGDQESDLTRVDLVTRFCLFRTISSVSAVPRLSLISDLKARI